MFLIEVAGDKWEVPFGSEVDPLRIFASAPLDSKKSLFLVSSSSI